MFKRIKLRKKTSGSSVTSEQKKYRKHIQRPFDAAFQCQFRVWGDGKGGGETGINAGTLRLTDQKTRQQVHELFRDKYEMVKN